MSQMPGKIWLHKDTKHSTGDIVCGYQYDFVQGIEDKGGIENFVEYVPADAFIEKALKWYCLDCECNDNCKDSKCFFHNEYERYLKGETNALPPKFTNRILNEDGDTSDDWRYRHFVSKMQDAFIKKACAWFKRIDYDDSMPPFETTEEFIEGFKKEMAI